jgi:3-deoxy-manno-octulosonate cytidylyltransferase (CMP-KDO synthetase)
VNWPVAPTEALESLEQLRFLWNGVKIHVSDSVASVPGGIDTEEDLLAVTKFF